MNLSDFTNAAVTGMMIGTVATAPPPDSPMLDNVSEPLNSFMEMHSNVGEMIEQTAEAERKADEVEDAIENPYEEPEIAELRDVDEDPDHATESATDVDTGLF